MAFLPQELCRTQEKTGPHLPPYHVCPLVYKNRKVPVGTNPVLICVPYYCFRCRPYDQFFLKFCRRVNHYARTIRICHKPVVGYHGTFFRESLNMLRLLAQEGFRDEKRKICVLVTGFLEHLVQLALHLLPDSIAPRLDHHTSPDSGILCQSGLYDQIVIPLRVVFLS